MREPTPQEQAIKAEWLEIWQQDRVQVLLEFPFTASLALHLEMVPVVDSRLPTAATDGRRVFFNPCFLQSLSAPERIFVLAHEVWHCVAGHLARTQGRDAELWNLAIDHEVNSLLIDQGFQMPEMGVFYPERRGWSAEQVYDWLLTKARPKDRKHKSFDQHEMQTALEGAGEDLVVDPDYSPGDFDQQTQREWRENLVAATQSCRQYGTLPQGLRRWVEQKTQPQLRWQDLLRQFVQRSYGGSRQWFPPARRHLYRGLYLPSTRCERLKIWVALDTSGSTHRDLPVFLAELSSLLTSFDRVELTLVECDTEIQKLEKLNEDQVSDLARREFQGFGGTSLIPPFDKAAEETPDCLVYLTDGYGPAPEKAPGFAVLWVLTEGGTEPTDWGQTVFLKSQVATSY